jgi:type IV pilus assembly protein PilY1
MVFNHGNEYEDGDEGGDGGHIVSYIADNNTSLEDIFLNQDVYTDHYKPLYPHHWTPLAETYYEATRYFRAQMSAYNNVDYSNKDPIQYRCQQNFVILITDGESTKDKNLPGTCFQGHRTPVEDGDNFNVQEWMDKIADNEGFHSQNCTSYSSDGTYYLEGVAYWAHVTDLRKDLKGFQILSIYTVYTFGKSNKAIELLNLSAKYGGF